MYKRDEMNNQKKRTPVKISKRFLNEKSEQKNLIGLIEKYNLIISIMEHLTLSRKKSSSTFLEKASQIMSNEELNGFVLKTYNILESAVIMWDMMGKGRGSAERNKIIRKRVYDSLNSLSSSETLSPIHAKSALGARSYGYYGGDPERTAYTKISEMKRRIIANTNANDKNTSYFFRYLFKALNPALFDEKTKSETDFEKYSVFNNLSKLKSIDEDSVKVLERFIFVPWLEEGDVVEFYLRHKQSIENSLITLIKSIKDKDFDNQIKADYLKLIFSIVNYIWDHFLPAEYYPHPGPHYYLQDISDNIFSDYEEGIYDYYKDLLKENKNVIKEEVKNPVRVSKRFLNEGQIRIGKNLNSLVDRFAMTNSKSRAGDIGEEIAVRYLKEVCNYSISRNANLDFKNDMPFADVWGIDSEGILSLVSVKSSSTIYKSNNNALINSNVKLKSLYSMVEYFAKDYDNFYNKAVSKVKTKKDTDLGNADIDPSIDQQEDLQGQKQLYLDFPQNFEIPVRLGIMSIDLGPSKRVYNDINKTIKEIASKSEINQMGSSPELAVKEIANKHSGTFKVGEDGNLYRIADKKKIISVLDFIDSMAESTWSSSKIFQTWREKRVNRIIEEMYGKNNNAYVMIRFFEKEVKFSISSSSSNTKIKILGDINKNDKITSGTQAGRQGFKVSSKPSFEKLSHKDFAYIGSGITLEDAAGHMTMGMALSGFEEDDDEDLSRYQKAGEEFTILSTRSVRNELHKELNDLLYYYLNNDDFKEVIATAKEIVNKNHGITVESVIAKSLSKLLIEKKKRRKKRRRSKCTPARRRINSGGKAGSYADPRTGGKQAYAALKKAKPPGSRGGWTKKKCICCHKCPNDRSAPNGFVCTNPSHLYWGTKADNTYDQNRGNGWAARNKKKNEGDPIGEKAFAYELMISEDKIRSLIEKIIKEDV